MRQIPILVTVVRAVVVVACLQFGANLSNAAPPAVAIVDCQDSEITPGLIGQQVDVYVKINSDEALGRADIRVQYGFPGLTFMGASAVSGFAEWEYFTWQHLPDTTYPDSGFSVVQLTAIADLDNGAEIHPDPFVLVPAGPVIKLRFWLTSNRNHLNQCDWVSIVHDACGQTTLHSEYGETVYVPIGSDASCYSSLGKTVFNIGSVADGRICLDEPPDDRGDINLDGVVYNIGDAALFTRYFIYGPEVWDPIWEDVQVLATDLNDDGMTGTVEDYKFLVKVLANAGRFQPSGDPCW